MAPYNTMSHVGLEDDYASKEQLAAMAEAWHYGWRWKGPEYEGTNLQAAGGQHLVGAPCLCRRAACGLVTVVEPECITHRDCRYGAAKQLHKASECPGGGNDGRRDS